MAGKIIADQIEGTTTTETVDGASVTIQNAIDTKYVVNGSGKAWAHFNGTGTAAINESFGTSSLTDNAEGRWHINLSNAFTNRNFPQTVASTAKTFNTAIDDSNKTSSQASLSCRNDAAAWVDTDGCVIDCLGDLA